MGFGGGLSSGGFTWNLDKFPEILDRVPLMLEENLKETQSKVDKAYEEKLALFDQLDSSRKENPSSYQSSFNSLAAGGKKDYLWHLYDTGELSKKEYKNQVHTAYEQEFVKNAQQGIYTGYVPFEHKGETLFVEARQFDPEVNDTFKSPTWFIKASIKPHDTFYFPEQHAKQPELTEKDWLVGMADNSGHIQYVDGFDYNPNKQGGYDSTVEGRAKNILDPDKGFAGTLAPLVSIAGAITGNPVLSAAGTYMAGGDLEDAIKSYALNQVTAPVLEETFATLGVDAELLGIDPETFTDSMREVQTTMLEGGSGTDALIGEFTAPLADKVIDTVKEVLPTVEGIDIDFDTPDIIKDIGDVALAGIEAVGDFVEPVAKKVVDVGQAAVDVVQEVTQPISDVLSEGEDVVKEVGSVFDDAVLQPVKEGVQAVTEPVVDVVDSFIDAVDSPLGALLETGGDLLGGMLGGGQGQQQQRTASTPTEGLFDKELFKFDTEIKSTQEMLSPMMNLRKYG